MNFFDFLLNCFECEFWYFAIMIKGLHFCIGTFVFHFLFSPAFLCIWKAG